MNELSHSAHGHVVAIRQFEDATGIDFDAALPNKDQERELEAEPAEATW